jgi:hypothetical protein
MSPQKQIGQLEQFKSQLIEADRISRILTPSKSRNLSPTSILYETKNSFGRQ